MDYQAVLFDFDYTLGDATASIYGGFCYGFEKMGLPKPRMEAVRETVGYILEDGFTILTGERDEARRAEFRRWFQEKVEGRQALPRRGGAPSGPSRPRDQGWSGHQQTQDYPP